MSIYLGEKETMSDIRYLVYVLTMGLHHNNLVLNEIFKPFLFIYPTQVVDINN